MSRDSFGQLMTPALAQRLHAVAEIDLQAVISDFTGPETAAIAGEAEVLLTGWGAPRVSAADLDRIA